MTGINRILAVCNDFDKCGEVLHKTAELAKKHDAGVTLMFVHEHELFELPIFSEEVAVDIQKIREELLEKVKSAGIDEAAIFIYENDTADRVALEVEKEHDTLVLTHYVEDITFDLVQKVKRPVLVLKAEEHTYEKAVIALDAVLPQKCLTFMHRYFEGVELHLYQDFQFVPIPAVDPVVEPLDVGMDATLYTELLEAKRKAFEVFCKEQGLKGTFEIGEGSIDEDTLAFAKKEQVDLLVLAPLDLDTLLGDAVSDILEKADIDVLVCPGG